jgi:hypothetical protein
MIECEFRRVDDDSVLETRNLETVPNAGEEIMIEGVAYQVATPPSDIIADSAIVYVKEPSGS